MKPSYRRPAALIVLTILALLFLATSPNNGAGASPAAAKHHPARGAASAAAAPICKFCGMRMLTHPTLRMHRKCQEANGVFYCCTLCGPHQTTGEMTMSMAKKSERGNRMGGRMTGH